MTALETKALTVYEILDRLSPAEIRFLEQADPFRFLVSVILSAQTTDRTVNSVARRLFAIYPTKETLANASVADVEEIIYPTGYYRMKAKNIVACAQALEERDVPSTLEDLVRLPGVGRKTANCVLGEVYARPAIIVDTHFGRVVRRLGLVSAKDPAIVEREIGALLEPRFHYRFSMTANLFGRTTCHAKKPSCDGCPLLSLCPYGDACLRSPAIG
jgi:endonuclease-3